MISGFSDMIVIRAWTHSVLPNLGVLRAGAVWSDLEGLDALRECVAVGTGRLCEFGKP
jgi:hypothetical protein